MIWTHVTLNYPALVLLALMWSAFVLTVPRRVARRVGRDLAPLVAAMAERVR